jgi:hypothetical protein
MLSLACLESSISIWTFCAFYADFSSYIWRTPSQMASCCREEQESPVHLACSAVCVPNRGRRAQQDLSQADTRNICVFFCKGWYPAKVLWWFWWVIRWVITSYHILSKWTKRFADSGPVQLVSLGIWSKVPAPLVVRHYLRKLHGIRIDRVVGFNLRFPTICQFLQEKNTCHMEPDMVYGPRWRSYVLVCGTMKVFYLDFQDSPIPKSDRTEWQVHATTSCQLIYIVGQASRLCRVPEIIQKKTIVLRA